MFCSISKSKAASMSATFLTAHGAANFASVNKPLANAKVWQM